MAARALAPLAVLISPLRAQDYSWPREITVQAGTIVLYQPQAEQLTGNQLTARGAIALKVAANPEPIFGAMWMTATVDVDRDSGKVWIHDVKVTRVRWPNATADQQQRFTMFVERDFPAAGFSTTIERLQASLASAEAERSHVEGLKSDAPKIVFAERLAVLLLYDGEPRTQPIDSSNFELVVNTPFGVVRDKTTGIYYLGGGGTLWYSARDAKGPWQAGATPPDELLRRLQPDSSAAPPAATAGVAAAPLSPDTATPRAARVESADARVPATDTSSGAPARDTTGRATPPDTSGARVAARDTATARAPAADTSGAPMIVTATQPTELVVTQGPPKWQTTAGGKLLYVVNTETPWIRETEGQDHYILIAGRWFKSSSLQGTWWFARPDSLPKAFQEIPPDSPIGGVRSSIAMTVEAQDAVLDLQIPQTTAVERGKATLSVTYDGEPKFTAISGTSVAYATNTASQVLRVAGAYYACDNGVWFKSAGAKGPWVVADSIPKSEIEKIPPSAPVYNVTYVDVYAATPTVVYVGYTPGYVGAYPYYGVPVYGTGWYYPPYMGAVYYPRPVTYGVSVSYNPYTGWGMGTTFATGFFAFSVGMAIGSSHHHGYYPPGGYRGCFNCTINVSPGRGGGGGGGRQNINIGNSAGGGNRQRPSQRPSGGRGGGAAPSQRPANSNLYNRPENRARQASPATRQQAAGQLGANRTARGSNNVFADRNGNVSRRTSSGWESRQGNNWSRDRSSSASREREWQARQRSSSRSSGGGYGGGRGGGRGGGGGRRR
jgi:hypothetical protein